MSEGWAAALAAFAGALSAPLFAFFQHSWEHKRNRRSLAIRLAVVLEKFAEDCASNIDDERLYLESKGLFGSLCDGIPELMPYPSDADWKLLNPNLLDRVLSFEPDLLSSEQQILFFDKACGPPDHDTRIEECCRCGNLAWELATELRHRHGFVPKVGTNTPSILKQAHEMHQSKTKKRDERNASKKDVAP